MRYKVIAKQYKRPGAFLIQLDTRIIRVLPEDAGRDLSVGETGRVMQTQTNLRFVPDAIEGEYAAV